MIYKSSREQNPITMEGNSSERRVKMWFATGTVDAEGETTRADAFKAHLDWFINEHGGPMNINHSNKVVGHWDKAGTGVHPETGKEGAWISGVVHRGPNGGSFPNADKAFKQIKDGKLKGGSWGGNILIENSAVDTETWEKEVDNAEVLPYEVSLVMDWDDGDDINPSDPNSTPIYYNDRAKTEEKNMTEEKEAPAEKDKSEDVYDAKKAIEDMTTSYDEKFSALTETLDSIKASIEKAKVDDEDEEEKEKAEDKDPEEEEEKEKAEVVVEDEKVLTDAQKAEMDQLVEDKFKALIEKVKTPTPPQKEVIVEKEKYDPGAFKSMSPADRARRS